jgi:hypothetical protein
MCGIRVSFSCFRDCHIFLIRGAFLIEGQGRAVDTGCSYVIKDEEWIGLCGSSTVIVIVEVGEQRGACRRNTQAAQEKMLREKGKRRYSKECILM